VLGARYSGKTTLLRYWRGEPWQPRLARTYTPEKPSATKVSIDAQKVKFNNLGDVSGAPTARTTWASLVSDCNYIVYLVDARALCGCLLWSAHRNQDRLMDDAGQIKRWQAGLGEGADARRCVIAVTHSDQDCRAVHSARAGRVIDGGTYERRVGEQMAPLIMQLGGWNRVRFIVGHLKDENGAHTLTKAILGHIDNWEGRR
jgi:hypothetical protein